MLLTVELAELRKKAGPAARYLRSKLEGRIRAYVKKEVSAFTVEKGSIPTAPDVLP